ncbi:tripartite tricarboxylate transporter substrate binding protein [Pigmentiphaga soli]|uniref:Tripartite tricarboxylate transporter substrate binding protein n=1 Tax=Pigmentiphaga soli TaxID=1007095 RepID=A0ABP8H057_9BURK
MTALQHPTRPSRRAAAGRLTAALCAAAALAALPAARAADAAAGYPDKPVRFVLPYPAGGPTDILGRILAQKLSERWGQPVVVVNRGGGGGTIGAAYAAGAPADGYTLFLGGISTLAINPFIQKSISYDPVKDFRPVSIATRQPEILVVAPSFQAQTLKDFIAYARANPGKVNFATSGIATSGHLGGELFNQFMNVKLVHIPYIGAGGALNAVMSGEVQSAFATVLGTVPLIKSGRLRALAITGQTRSPALPDVPTFAEQGFGDYDATAFNGVLVPAGTPEAIVRKINADLVAVLADPEVVQKLSADGTLVRSSSPDEFAALIKAEQAKWEQVIRQGNIRID